MENVEKKRKEGKEREEEEGVSDLPAGSVTPREGICFLQPSTLVEAGKRGEKG